MSIWQDLQEEWRHSVRMVIEGNDPFVGRSAWRGDAPYPVISGEDFKSARKSLGLTQSKLARFIGCSRATIGNIENGHVRSGKHGVALERLCAERGCAAPKSGIGA